ncbi:osmoprotectant transport system substrate-binding protein [Amycolatopsis marina]|uniref:Osmoprotectant transport system substrate-binding protein n=1 Tax=Amycolatopsis marina TaxID=490629 RepID=A0A1I0W366_9PSEU|nr:glycine betaine ABC transporter substrate-binding protein [Amycolatopsis marina]SFA82788.1 osmoprotectant transport system substrate-binding protein [Amycolatopsis marina]
MKHRLKAALGTALLGVSLAGCGLDVNAALPYKVEPGSIQAVPELAGVDVTVGSKDFTEQILLGYMAELALSAAGADVTDLTDIKGSSSSRQALLSGEVDVMWEYTGTGWINYLGNEQPVPGGEQAQYEATRKADLEQNGVVWLDYSPLNNQYGLATTEEYAAQHDLATTSDLAAFLKENPAEAVYCLETEFISRQDGFPAAENTYGLPVAQVMQFGIGAIYAAVDGGTCPIGEVFTTDGRIAGLGLRVMEDDKLAFPQYNAAITVRKEYLDAHPQIADVLQPVSDALDNETLIELNKQVDVDGREPGEVARDWMVEQGFITTPDT